MQLSELMKYKIPLWKHQEEGLEKALEHQNFALLMEQGCLAHDTKIKICIGSQYDTDYGEVTIRTLYELYNKKGIRDLDVYSYDAKTGLNYPNKIERVYGPKIDDIYKITLKNGMSIKATLQHEFLTKRGWLQLKDLKIQTDYILTFKGKHRSFSKLKSLEFNEHNGVVFDIECKEPRHNYIAEGMVVHNSGKTPLMVNILRHLFACNNKILRTLVLCPVIVVENWLREFKEHSYISKVHTLKGPGKKRVKEFMELTEMDTKRVFITNYESLQNNTLYEAFDFWCPEVIVCDESSRIKSHKAKRTKKAIALGDKAIHKYILSGTPILNSGMDIWSQYRFLDGGKTFDKNFYIFRTRYFYDRNAGIHRLRNFPQWEAKTTTYQEFNDKIYSKAFRVLKKECLDLPPIVRQKINVEMSKDQEKTYREMEKDFITFLGSNVCTAQIALTKGLRLQQIVSGFFKDSETGEEIPFKSNPRDEALNDLLVDISEGAKVIIWACFKANYKAIEEVCKKCNLKYVTLVGGMTEKKREEAISSFQEDKSVRVLIGNQGAAGIGCNLTSASYMIYYSRNFSLEQDLQSEARCHRGGSEMFDKITRYDIVTPETIDELVLKALHTKQNIAEVILKWKKRG